MSKFYTYATVQGNNILYRYVENGQSYIERVPYEPTMYTKTGHETQLKTLFDESVEPLSFNSIRDCKTHIKDMKDVYGYTLFGNSNFEQQLLRDEYPKAVAYDPQYIRGHFVDIEVHSETGEFPHAEHAEHPIVAIGVYDTMQKAYMVLCYHPTQKFDSSKIKLNEKIKDVTVVVKQCASEEEVINDWIKLMQGLQPNWISGWNSEKFDLPYLVHRIEKLFGKERIKDLSPFNCYPAERTIKDDFGNEHTVYQIKGIPHLDYLLVYKKHTFVTQESYKLDHIAEVELGENKIEYDGTIRELYENDFQLYIEYNIQDVRLMVKLEEKLRLMDVTYALAYFCKINYQDTLSPVKSWEGILYNKLLDNNIVQPLHPSGKKDGKFSGAHVKSPKVGLSKWVVSCDLNSLYPHLIQQYNLGPDTKITDAMLPPKIWHARQNELQFLQFKMTRAAEEVARIKAKEKRKVKEGDVADAMLQEIEDVIIHRKLDTSFLKGTQIAMAPNATFYRTDKMSILSATMRDLYTNRKGFKKQMLAAEQKKVDAKAAGNKDEAAQWENEEVRNDNMQMAMKILLNSGYGALGTDSFKYFDVDVAEAITRAGRLSIRWIAQRTNEYFEQVTGVKKDVIVAIDTDSVYIDCEGLVNAVYNGQLPTDEHKIVDLLDQIFETTIVPKMAEWYEELAQYLNAYENRMFMAREVIAPRAFWTAKKRYFMEVWNSEGVAYNPPKLKVMGLEAVRSTTPQLIRETLKKVYKICLRGDNNKMIEFYNTFKTEYMQLPIQTIALGSAVNGLNKYADEKNIWKDGSGAQSHVKAALIFNHHIKLQGLSEKYEEIKEGEKIKYVLIKKPNLLKEEVVGFTTKLPPEFRLERCIDKDAMFQKAFTKPITSLMELLEWDLNKKTDISDFF